MMQRYALDFYGNALVDGPAFSFLPAFADEGSTNSN